MIRVNIYRIVGCYNCDWRQVERNKYFRSIEKAHNYCAYIAPRIHGRGEYAYILIK